MAEQIVQFGKLPYQVITTGGIAGLTRAELGVYVILATHIGDNGWTSNPSTETVARLAGVASRTVRRAIRSLSVKGLIEVEQGGGRHCTNTYRLVTKPGHPDVRVTASNPDTQMSAFKGETRTFQGLNPDILTPKPGHLDVHPKAEKHKSKSTPVELPETLDTSRFRQAWEEWGQHRQEIKHPLTPTSAKRQLKMLAGLGHDAAIASIEKSIECGWRNVFPPDADKGKPSSQAIDLNEIVGMDDELAKQLLAAPDPDA